MGGVWGSGGWGLGFWLEEFGALVGGVWGSGGWGLGFWLEEFGALVGGVWGFGGWGLGFWSVGFGALVGGFWCSINALFTQRLSWWPGLWNSTSSSGTLLLTSPRASSVSKFHPQI